MIAYDIAKNSGCGKLKQIVEEILSGKFNWDNGSLDFSCTRLELSVHTDTIEEGSFSIYGPEGKVTEGYVLSSDLRMECITGRFGGSTDEISYRFHAKGMEAGEEITGAFHIISNHGEYYLPFSVTILPEAVTSSLGNIKNLFHFTNLAKTNWEEAVKLFYTDLFKTIFTGNDRQYYAVYKGLSAVPGNEHNVEEFLRTIHKKKPVELLPEENEIRIENPLEMTRYGLVINKNGWGYVRLEIEAEGEFLRVEEESVSEDAFLGNIYRLYYYIDLEKLHAGNNYGKITLRQDEWETVIPVTVALHVTSRKVKGLQREKKQLTLALMEYYQAFRLKKISTRTWMSETGKLLSRMLEIDDRDVTIKLFQAQLLLTEERYNEAKWMIEKQEEQVLASQAENPELWCYYLYLTTLYSKDEQYIDEVTAEVAATYERNRGNWRIAWLYMYLSEEYVRSPSRKWVLLEELFQYHCTSPVIYIEAWHLLCMNPAMLLRLNAFEMQILSYAVKHDLMKDEIVLQLVYLAQKQKTYSEGLLRILAGCYERKPQEDILHAICTLLIKGNCQGESYFNWYRLGVEQNLRITRLYEYYMMSLPGDFKEPLPKMILMYFAYQSDLPYTITAWLYAYVHKHQAEIPEIYANYESDIERFVLDQIKRGRINEDLAYLYRNVISLPMIDEESAGHLVSLLFMQELTIEKEGIKEVLLSYPDSMALSRYPVVAKKCQVPVYTSGCKILLGDEKGNLYAVSVPYGRKKLMNPARLSLMLSPFVRDNLGYAGYICYEYQNVFEVHEDNVDLFVRLADSEYLEPQVRQKIRMKIIKFYYDKDRMRELDEYLLLLKPTDVTIPDRKEVVRYLVVRGMYEEGFRWICECGPYGMDTKTLVRLCSRLLAEEETDENPVMTGVLYYVLQKGKYDENILKYLVRYYHGSTKAMRDVWKAADSYGVDTYELCARILIQMLYTGAYVGEKKEIFLSYEKNGGNDELMAAFLAQCCYDYAVREKIVDTYVFEGVAKLYQRQIPLHLVNKIAYLKFYAENKQEQTMDSRAVCTVFLQDLLQEQLVFAFYKEYQGYLPQLDVYLDKTILEYRVKPDSRAVIHYVIQGDGENQNEYCKEEMKNMFGGICVKEFTLFFGERMQYYITEEVNGKEQLTQSGTINKSDIGQENFEGRFSILNDIMIGKTLQDYDTVDKLLHEYYQKDFLVNKLFSLTSVK